MEDGKDLRARLLPTPFVSSWMGRARDGDLNAADHATRAAAWAHWAVLHLAELVGNRERHYPALLLDGKFWVARGAEDAAMRPHLEIPRWLIDVPAPEFPDRLALAGNGLNFRWWVVPEVLAVKRTLFGSTRGSIEQLTCRLSERRDALVSAVEHLNTLCAPRWNDVEAMMASRPETLTEAACAEFSVRDVAEFFDDGAAMTLRVVFDEKLRDGSGRRAASRVGVWKIQGVNEDGHRFELGVITPRLTANSLFRDQHFGPAGESSAALLVRGLVLNRIWTDVLGGPAAGVEERPAPARPGNLRAIVAQAGAKIPEASVEAAVNFLHTYPDANTAWDVLCSWAQRTSTQLTVLQEGFLSAHRRALRLVQRAEEPSRSDINIVLPLGWDDHSRVVRATFSRGDVDDG